MKWIDFLVIAVIALILGLVFLYLHRAKKKGIHCVGCPNASSCSGHCTSCSEHCNPTRKM